MGKRIPRSQVLADLRDKIARGEAIVGCGAGTGISAKMAEAGGADLIIIYNSGRYRMAGRGSLAGLLPYGDANAIVVDMAREVIPVVKRTPVLAGICGTDPFRDMEVFLHELAALNFTGVQNFPTVGLIDGVFRGNLEGTGMGYKLEVEYATRMSNSGIFVHAAPWSVAQQGYSNTSHGCLNVSTEDAKWFMDNVKKGDPVVVKNTKGGTLSTSDGWGDWN